jgi:LDH2 family malate/lactate/ureidoglycolate dehydrogenase
MSQIAITDLRHVLQTILTLRGLTEAEAYAVSEHYIDAELRGHRTHGVTKILTMNQAIKARAGRPVIVSDNGIAITVDAQRELGPLGAQFAVDTLLSRAQSRPVAVVIVKNVGRYGCIYPFGKQIADAGKIGIIMNSGGPATVAPVGGYTPVMGSNPFCLAFPRRGQGAAPVESLVIDMATSETAWSHSFIGAVEGYPLPPNIFFDSKGNYTTRPQAARALHAFGGPKGYALCLALEIFCGALLGAGMGSTIETDYDCGFFFLALDPAVFRGSADAFYAEVEAFIHEIKSAPEREGEGPIMIPGEGSEQRRRAHLASGAVEIDEYTWSLLTRMALDPMTGMNLGVSKGFR